MTVAFTQIDRARRHRGLQFAVVGATLLLAVAAFLVGRDRRPSVPRAVETVRAATSTRADPVPNIPVLLPSPTTTSGGLPTGFPDTDLGAVATAAAIADALTPLDGSRDTQVMTVYATPEDAVRLGDQLVVVAQSLRAQFGLRAQGDVAGAFIAYQPREFQVHDGAAGLTVWLLVTETDSVGGQLPAQRTTTLGIPLVWTPAGWRMTADDLGPGPAAARPDSDAATALGWRALVEPLG